MVAGPALFRYYRVRREAEAVVAGESDAEMDYHVASMRHRSAVATTVVVIVVALTLRAGAQDHTQFMDVAAENLFRYSRAAISGGGKSVNDLRSLVLKGRSRFVVDDNGGLAGAAVEIKLLLPDHYLRIDSSGVLQKVAGYAGKSVLSAMHDGADVTYPPERLLKQILLNEKLRVARLLLGATTYVGADLTLRFRSVPKSVDMVDPRVNARTAVTIENSTAEPFAALVTGDNFAARFVVDGTTRAPTQIEYTGADKNPVVVAFGDRRLVGGLQMPFHILTTSGGRIVDELVLDEILVNAELSKNDFKR